MATRSKLPNDTQGAIAPLVAVTLGCMLAIGAVAFEAGRAYLTHARLERALVLAVTSAAPALAVADPAERAATLAGEATRSIDANIGSNVALSVSEGDDGRLHLRGQMTLRLLLGQLIGRGSVDLAAVVTTPVPAAAS